ncbi:PAS domain S-box protein [Halomicroarcula sp. S1AR25-4]|uniref:PAS domain S-box protein n=1 Tax=Haloarcula sp. S1AR25-4 TaxID=2950538 RepID=UPI0028771FE0|nr:PAS domain S-box protein [Halomicroarcula sp. S1AR25-4]MDS0278724.1 PAS domain S-box protein [Halomicroarcula sp. S1AR25-4]
MTRHSLTEALRETLALFDGAGTPVTTTEAAERLGLGRRSTYDRLDRLVDRGRLDTKKVGASARVWWRPPSDDPAGEADADRVFETAPVELVAVAADGTVDRANARARRALGLDGSAGSVTTALEFYDEGGDSLPPADHPIRTVLEDDATVTDRLLGHETPNGDRRWVRLTASPVAAGDSDGAVLACTDVTSLRRTQAELERHRERVEDELREVFDRIDDAFFALDEEWRFTHVNDRAATLLDRSADELVGESVWDAFPEAVNSQFQTEYERAFETQESRSFEAYYPPLATWFEVTAYPSETGLSVYFRDVTDRVERERELERYETIVETVEDGIYVADDDGHFTHVNESYASMVGYDPSELVGKHVSAVVDDDGVLAEAKRLEQELATGERTQAVLEAELETADGDTFAGEATFALFETEDGYERVGVVRDVTDRTERERELELYESIVETVDDGIYAVDTDGEFVLVNEQFCELTGYEEAELLGADATTVHGEVVSATAESIADEVVSGGRGVAGFELDVQTSDGDTVPCESRFSPFPLDDGFGRCGVVRDISDRLDREDELKRRVHQQEVVTDLGQRALADRDVDALMAEATELVAETLDNEYCKVLDLDAEAEELSLREGVGWDDGLVGSATVSAVADDSQASYTLASSAPVVVEDLTTERRFSGPDLLTDHDVRSGISVIVGPQDDPWGILGTHDTARREFTDHDVNFVQSIAAILASAIARHDDEQELVRQRERLDALNNLNEVVREITEAVATQSTREEIEQTVCEHLADADSYQFAWIGEGESTSQRVVSRTEAGVDGYLDGIELSVDPDDDRIEGPTGEALRTGEVRTRQDITTAKRWADHADAHGFRASAAVPITHEDTMFGVLNVYTARSNAFEGEERVVIGQLGDIVGHAIAATQRKQALMSDEVVELEFHVPDIFETLDIGTGTCGTISLDHAIPVADDEYVVYGSATPDATESVRTITDAVPHWESVTFRENGDEFEARLSEPPVLSVVASVGGFVESAVIEDGDYRMTIRVSPTVDARQIIDVVTDAYPAAQLLKRRQRTRDSDDRLQRELTEALTDRQRTALEAAYHAGFFEWPRDASGQDVADSLGIAASTFHQHLRKAERKVLDRCLTTAIPTTA